MDFGHSPDLIQERIALLKTHFPEVFSEGRVDVERLKQALDAEALAPGEHYELSWAGKAAARREIQQKTTATLQPGQQVGDLSGHILIEGENLEVLRVLQRAYFGKVKMIYIDPPYNTGNDSFVYPDDYTERRDEYEKRTGLKDEEGYLNAQNFWKKNTKENGQFHSVWLSMMYPRLYMARNLLREDGVIFISIDDNEAANLKLLCDEVFGEENFVADIIVVTNMKGRNDKKHVASCHEHILIFQKSIFKSFGLPLTSEQRAVFKYEDNAGEKYALRDLRKRGGPDKREDRPNMFFPIYWNPTKKKCSLERLSENDIEILPLKGDGSDGCWRWGKDKIEAHLSWLHVKKNDKSGRWGVEHRVYLDASISIDNFSEIESDEDDLDDEEIIERTSKSKSIWIGPEFSSDNGKRELKEFFSGSTFSFPKSVDLVKQCVQLGAGKDDLVFDFFAGSGTTTQAVLELNEEDGGNRRCMLVQLPEPTAEGSEARKAGYATIADITRARMAKVIEKIAAARIAAADKAKGQLFEAATVARQPLGFAHYTLAESNFKVWRSDVQAKEAIAEQLSVFRQAELPGSNPVAMLTELLLKAGLGLETRWQQADGFYQTDRGLWACFDPYTPAMKDALIAGKPGRVVFLNSCFTSDQDLANLKLELEAHEIVLTIV